MLETETLEQIKDYIFEQLPRVLEKDPRFVVLIEGIVAEKFPRGDDFTRLLDELRELRLNTERQFDELRSDMNRRFEQADKRIEQTNKRIEQMDKRIEQIDKRIDQMDNRFDQMDKRFDRMDKRFEQIDKRLEAGDLRMDRMEQEIKTGFHEVHVHIDRLGSRWGIRNEKIFRQTMKSVLEESMGMTVKECFIGGEQFDCIISNGQHILIEIAASVGANIQERLLRKRQLYTDETGISPHRFILAVGSIHSRRAEALRADGFEVIEPEE